MEASLAAAEALTQDPTPVELIRAIPLCRLAGVAPDTVKPK